MSKYGFQTKLFAAYSVFIALLIFISFYTFYWFQSKSMEKTAVDNQSQLTVKTSEQVDALIREMDKISLQIVYNPLLTQMIEDAFHDKDRSGNYFEQHLDIGRQARDILASINGPNLTVSRISLFNSYGDYLSSGTIPENEDVIRKRLQSEVFQTDYNHMKEYEGRVFLSLPHDDYWSGESDKLFSLIREFRNVYDSYGMIEVQQPYSLLAKTLNMENLPDTEVLLLNEKGETVYGNTDLMLNTAELTEKTDEAKAVDDVYFKLEPSNGMSDQLVTFRELSNINWMIYLITDENKLLEPIRSLGKLLIFLSLGLFFSALFVVFIITRQLTLPLKKLRNSVRSVSINNLSIDLGKDAGHNELILLNRAFYKMFERLRMSVDQVIEAKSAEADARFHALQSQMNPHFLYNVLSVISAAGQQAGVTKVMELCHKLSMMLRYITSYKSGNVTIQDECEYAELYLELMKERYEDYFEYDLVIDEAVKHVEVPRLILQPLIENCFHHAFQSVSPPWKIRVQIGQAPEPANQWVMRIEDNGSGFDAVVLKRLLAQTNQLDKGFSAQTDDGTASGVGLTNTIVRLKLLYADKAIVAIEPRSPQGTIVTIGGALDDSCHDRRRRNAYYEKHQDDDRGNT
ncbi:sensor histidine kinase [Paenibacillus faecalis]|uniref:sensor histidine kinase n=1 Tax=Paenibacillus faecalis TaxID=2079532 RepID=UPI000D0F071B|nr:histidine kinase [Paenibacillus faecalis]